ncbi:hypothetical protein BK816_02710 [Boudabousia tangfeifanii]|uniref:Lipoprotein n=1 Tax=Boudabousia tangfeifanii TaxID=1912795 RepID=A0A1D9MJ63_9ACTO|nr:hypothetical protein [Boudabousia tangfeifanii]AOZ72345.1 hypothetical protein BK816_02710 [Boudabousia tangfeifanii]
MLSVARKEKTSNRNLGVKALVLAAIAPMALGLVGCSDSSGGSAGTSKDDVEKGILKIYTPQKDVIGINDEQVKEIASCFANDIEGKISEESRKKIASGIDIPPNSPDYQAVFDASKNCAQKVITKK